MTRLTVTIPASTAPAVNAALEAALGPIATNTFSTHPPHPTDPDALDTTVMVCSWDLASTGHEHAVALVAATVEQLAKTGSGKTAKTADIKVGDEPRLATKTTAAELTVKSDPIDSVDSTDLTASDLTALTRDGG
jgi:hypothetical protein